MDSTLDRQHKVSLIELRDLLLGFAFGEGLAGNLGEVSAWLDKNNNAWLSKNGEGDHGWEEVPYWLRGYGDVGYLLGDKNIIAEAELWLNSVFQNQRPDGYFGKVNLDKEGRYEIWANMIMLNCLQSYYESTKEIFNKIGCSANYVENEKAANFKIKVVRYKHLSALPQEWLTGLSFGLIPSWGTRENEYQYTFENVNKNKANTYYVDKHSFNHIILFPIFWVSFFTIDEDKVYKEALTNFIEGS